MRNTILGATTVMLGAVLSLLGAAQTPAKADDIRLANIADVPHYQQRQDFSALMNPRDTDLVIGPNRITYANLPLAGGGMGNPDVHFDPRLSEEWTVGVNPPAAGVRDFRVGDLADINGGNSHCAPSTGAMIMQYWSTRGFPDLARGAATEVAYIDAIADRMDTNDQNRALRAGVRGHMGTFNADIVPGLTAFALARNAGYQVNAAVAAFNAAGYAAEIRANRPVYLIAANPGVSMMHAVCGVGYRTNLAGDVTNVFISDPWNAVDETMIGLPTSSINVDLTMARRGGERFNMEGDVSITTFDSQLEDAVMITFDVVPEPAALVLLVVGGLVLLNRRC